MRILISNTCYIHKRKRKKNALDLYMVTKVLGTSFWDNEVQSASLLWRLNITVLSIFYRYTCME